MEPLGLVDMKDVHSRHTGLSLDYTKPCTLLRNRLCHVSNTTAAWNGFFVNVGLELQESSSGDLSLTALRNNMKKACRATHKEKAQAATLLHWLLTKHRCVKSVSISEDVFVGLEDIVCSALSGSVGVTVVELLVFSSWQLLSEAVITSLNSVK